MAPSCTDSARTSASGAIPKPIISTAGRLLDDPAVGVIDVDGPALDALGDEQRSLRREVVLHSRVEIEMILTEVREGRRFEMQRFNAMEGERVRGDLERDRGDARPTASPPRVRWRSSESGVVLTPGLEVPAMRVSMVPISPATWPAAARIGSRSQVVVVLPLVPVTPSNIRSSPGRP